MPTDPKLVRFKYKNHRGETRIRQVLPDKITFTNTPHHPGPAQWMLHAYDVEKGENRFFVMKDISEWTRYPEGQLA